MKIKNTFFLLFGFIITSMVVILVFIILLLMNRSELQKSQINRYHSYRLGENLRQSYDNLSKCARNFVFTGDPTWEERYLRILQIRNGELADNSGMKISIQDSMKNMGFTELEFELLGLSESESNFLVFNEMVAINAAKGIFIDNHKQFTLKGEPDIEYAKSILYSTEYSKLKREISGPIDQFNELINKRTRQRIDDIARQGWWLFMTLLVFIGLVILISVLAYLLIKKQLNEQIKDIKERKIAEQALAEKEQQMQYAMDVSNEGIWDFHVLENSMHYSYRCFSMLGFAKSEISNENLFWKQQIHHQDTELSLMHNMNKVISQGVFDNIFRVKSKIGDYKWIHAKGKAVEVDEASKPLRIVGTITDITERMKQEEQIINAVLETENKERSRIARDIHDGLQQTMSTSLLSFEKVRNSITFTNADLKERFNVGYTYLKKSISESRTLAHNLMPKVVDEHGIVAAINSLLHAIESSSKTEFIFHQNLGDERLKLAVEMTLYRITQEAINNIIKSADAQTSTIQLLKYDDMLVLTIEDNGKGFDISKVKTTFGLNSMKTRAESIGAFLQLDSSVGKGTQVLVELPV